MSSKYEIQFDWLKENCNDRDIEEFLRVNDSELPYIYAKNAPDIAQYGNDNMIAQEASDEMAASVLRLQHSLDKMIERLDSIEGQLKQIQQQNTTAHQVAAASKKSSMFGSPTVNTLVFLGWPVVVFAVIKVLERRRMAIQL